MLVSVGYFSARIQGEPGATRQATYIDALKAANPLLSVTEGRFQSKELRCRQCGHIRISYEEKETDVNLALARVEGAVQNRYDRALLISGDGDLCPAVRSVHRLAPDKHVVAMFPPRRSSGELRMATHGALTISDSKIRNNLLPETVTTQAGIKLVRPARWY